ncbi:MAG: SurA N-terminal domain-containing protein [Chthonomonadaceae bacterium]|nr:SurA N-terminal domain-containing protein [Chthonomonadaceae bacterium]
MPDLLSIETWRTLFTRHGSKLGWGLALLFGAPLVVGFGVSQYANRANSAAEANVDRNAVVATINGVPVTRQQYVALAFQDRTQVGEQAAVAQGAALQSLAQRIVIEQEAASRKVGADDAEVDKAVQDFRTERLGKDDAKDDAKWSEFLQGIGRTSGEFRQEVSKSLLGPALVNSYKSEINVTEADAKNQSAEAKLQVVMIGVKSPMFPSRPGKGAQPLEDAAAKAKAIELQAQAKAGADLTSMAKMNSTDTATALKGGVLEWRPEYAASAQTGGVALGYGKDFDTEVHKTPNGQITGVVHQEGAMSAYLFAKVLERRNTLPKTFNAAKVIATLKDEKAKEKVSQVIQDKTKAAKIEIKDPKIQTFYDYYRLKTAERAEMMAQFMPEAKKDILPKEEVAKLQTSVDAGLETMLKADPNDTTAAQLLATSLERKPQTPVTRDRMISLYETILKGSENQQTRVKLAGLYRDKKDMVKAKEQFDQIAKIQGRKPIYNTESATEAKSTYTGLIGNYKSVNAPEDAAKMEQKLKLATDKELQYKLEDLKNKSQNPQPGNSNIQMPVPQSTPPPAPTATPAPSGKR